MFAGVIAAAYAPNVLHVFSLLDDYDVLSLRSEHFFFHLEAEHLFSVARPLAALFTNLPILPIQSADDFRWMRILSILTVCVMGGQMIANCIVRLNTRKLDAVVVSLAIFLVPSFIYAILSATAWVPHLMTTFIVIGAYTLLGRSNIQAMPFLVLARRRDYRAFWHQVFVYSCLRPVWTAGLVYQLAFYNYPPYATIMVVFPIIGILFSQAPLPQRTLIALRDVGFIGASFVLYFLSTTLIYLPFVRLFTLKGTGDLGAYENEFVATGYANHQFMYNTDFGAILTRLESLLTISGDLWFLPQMNMHILVAVMFLLALLLANTTRLFGHREVQSPASVGIGRLSFILQPLEGLITVFILACCFVMAATPVLASAGGFVAYRTSVSTIAVTAIVFVFSVRCVASAIWRIVGNPLFGAATVGTAATVMTVGVAFAANFDVNYAVMKLGRNEFAYFSEVVRQAIDNKSKAIILLDPRPPGAVVLRVSDEQGRPVPGSELGCFASYCTQTGSIVRVAGTRFGLPLDAFEVLVPRGDSPVPGLSCEMLTAPTPSYPPNASERSVAIVSYYRTLVPLTCVTVSMAWHDLGIDMRRGVKQMKISHR